MRRESKGVDTFIENGPYSSRIKQLGWHMMVFACGFQPGSKYRKSDQGSQTENLVSSREYTNFDDLTGVDAEIVVKPETAEVPEVALPHQPEQLVLELQFYDQ
jgi:hypothetical protein